MKIITASILLTLWVAVPGHLAWAAGDEPDVRSYNLGHGRKIFSEKCMKCHEEGKEGAPILGELGDWKSRMQQPLNILVSHAIKGHGEMPPKGDLDLTDQDVASAVAYVIYHGRLIAEEQMEEVQITDTEAAILPCTGDPEDCTPKTPSDSVVIKMLWLITNQTSTAK